MGEVLRFPGGSRGPITLAQVVSELERDEQEVVRRRWGLARELQSDDAIAESLGVDVEVVWGLHDHALQTIGFLWLTETLLPTHWWDTEVA